MPKDLSPYANLLADWAAQHPRPMPWKGIKDPYRIWLSEIILQQTRVEQGLPYYERFLVAFPTVTHLAQAPLDEVYRLWEGLGYYSRARNLHEAAKTVVSEHGGTFPANYAAIRALKGVGDYTAAAITSFAFGMPYAVVDGNVYRVLSRWLGIHTPIDTLQGKKTFEQYAQQLLQGQDPARHNQAMMDFGATWCTPKRPQCAECPFQAQCAAFQTGTVEALPVKSKKTAKKERFFVYWVIVKDNNTFLVQREAKDIWQHLWTFPSTETADLPQTQTAVRQLLKQVSPTLSDAPIRQIHAPVQQVLTHRLVKAVFVEIDWVPALEQFLLRKSVPAVWSASDLPVPVPRIIDLFWQSRHQPQLSLQLI